jgi:hypothetical protein
MLQQFPNSCLLSYQKVLKQEKLIAPCKVHAKFLTKSCRNINSSLPNLDMAAFYNVALCSLVDTDCF